MGGFAVYRLPNQTECTLVVQHEGDPEELHSPSELNGRSGYVVAPFAVTEREPLLLIRADEVVRIPLFTSDMSKMLELTSERLRGLVRSLNGEGERIFEGLVSEKVEGRPSSESLRCQEQKQPREQASAKLRYHIDFANFHAHLLTGEFQKIVLSRCSYEPLPVGVSPLQLFQKACERYPRMFVTLVSTRRSGLWLMATPEILLEGSGRLWRTIALAGTMEIPEQQQTPDWSTKNIQEQRFVATYITECLEQFLLGEAAADDFSHDIDEDGPYTTQAANVLHLRSDFNFSLPEHARIGNLLRRLHPTPAVCGLPKQQTFDFIRRNESISRSYYSGFTGPLFLNGETHLFVSLRCMQIAADGCHLYAGGGLLRDSVEEQEWQETESKLEAMRALLVPHSSFTVG